MTTAPTVPRLRVFAGPNGSGKSTIKDVLPPQWLGLYVNADEFPLHLDAGRHQLLAAGVSFTFETVMSSDDKVEFLRKAQAAGFRTYLYFVATEDPEINIARVQHRVRMGGHSVPPDKIVNRYQRSLELLSAAVNFANRAYIFDNSGHERVWIAEVTNGQDLELHTDHLPHWFVDTSLWRSFLATDSDSTEPDSPTSA